MHQKLLIDNQIHNLTGLALLGNYQNSMDQIKQIKTGEATGYAVEKGGEIAFDLSVSAAIGATVKVGKTAWGLAGGAQGLKIQASNIKDQAVKGWKRFVNPTDAAKKTIQNIEKTNIAKARKLNEGYTDAINDLTNMQKVLEKEIDRVSKLSTKEIGNVGKTVKLDKVKEVAKNDNLLKIKRGKDGKITGVTNTQEHHIVPQKLRDHELFERAGMTVETSYNKMLLPTKKGAAAINATNTRSIHEGRHVKEVEEELREKMEAALEDGIANSWMREQYQKALKRIIYQERELLKSGDRALNKNARPWADQ